MTNDGLTHVFMGQPILVKKVVIEKMTKGAVSYVVEQGGDPEQCFDVGERGNVTHRLRQTGIHVFGILPGQMHGAQGMLKPAVFRGRIHPSCALQLIDVPKALEPGRIDEIFFSRFVEAGCRVGNRKLNVVMNRIGNEGNVVRDRLGHCVSRGKRWNNPIRILA